jgi:hypothetical protein
MRSRADHFQIRSLRRTYDRKEGKFKFFIEYETSTKPTPRSIVVSEAFGLGLDESRKFPVLDTELKIGPRDIVYITGDSGSGSARGRITFEDSAVSIRKLPKNGDSKELDPNDFVCRYIAGCNIDFDSKTSYQNGRGRF